MPSPVVDGTKAKLNGEYLLDRILNDPLAPMSECVSRVTMRAAMANCKSLCRPDLSVNA